MELCGSWIDGTFGTAMWLFTDQWSNHNATIEYVIWNEMNIWLCAYVFVHFWESGPKGVVGGGRFGGGGKFYHDIWRNVFTRISRNWTHWWDNLNVHPVVDVRNKWKPYLIWSDVFMIRLLSWIIWVCGTVPCTNALVA